VPLAGYEIEELYAQPLIKTTALHELATLDYVVYTKEVQKRIRKAIWFVDVILRIAEPDENGFVYIELSTPQEESKQSDGEYEDA
jgi:hypothetical protein